MRAIDGADAVVHLAGAGVFDEAWTRERREVLRSSRIRSTELLAEAIARAERKPRVFVSGSAIGIYGTSTGDRTLTDIVYGNRLGMYTIKTVAFSPEKDNFMVRSVPRLSFSLFFFFFFFLPPLFFLFSVSLGGFLYFIYPCLIFFPLSSKAKDIFLELKGKKINTFRRSIKP